MSDIVTVSESSAGRPTLAPVIAWPPTVILERSVRQTGSENVSTSSPDPRFSTASSSAGAAVSGEKASSGEARFFARAPTGTPA